jgi:hypothetical protein
MLQSRKKNVVVTQKLSKNGFDDHVAFNFHIESEKELGERLLKAFNHLKSFCKPTVDEKEPF